MSQRFEASGHASLVYDDLGASDAPAVVLLHGLAMHRDSWLELPRQLASTYRVLALDLRGHGESDKPGIYRLKDYASDVAALIEQVVGAPAALVGHSMGGVVAAQVAGTRPELVDRVLFEDPPLHMTSGEAFQAAAQRPFVAEAFRARVEASLDGRAGVADSSALVLQEMMETADFIRPWQQLLFARRDRGAGSDELVASIQADIDALGFGQAYPGPLIGPWVTGLLTCDPRIFETPPDSLDGYDPKRPMACPVLVLRADPSVGPSGFPPEAEPDFLSTHPNARVEFVEGASHSIHFQMPERFSKSLEAFLAL